MEEQMVKVGKIQGGAAVGPYEWVNNGDVIDVPSSLAAQLLRQPGGGFFDPSQTLAPQNPGGTVQAGFSADPEPAEGGEGKDGDDGGEPAEGGTDPAAPEGKPADPPKTPAKTPAAKKS